MINVAYVLVVMSLMDGCATERPLSYSAKRELFSASCVAQGGRVVGNFSALAYRCEWPTTDSGKACRTNSDCLGVCGVPGDALRESPAKAKCQADCANSPPRFSRPRGYVSTVEECKQDCISILEYAVPVGTRMDGVCSAQRYDFKTVNCMTLYIDNGKVTEAPCYEE